MKGQRIGNYRVVRLLGKGSRGALYEAIHEPSDRRVALKLLRQRAGAGLPGTLRSLNGAWAVARVQHPGLVAVLDSGQFVDGTIYVAMEYLPGESLDARLRRQGALPVQPAVQLSHQIAATLGAAHQKGVTHHNLRPDKVMIVADDDWPGGERVKVLDLGLLDMLGQSAWDSASSPTRRLQAGLPMGTPTYMAPEQCRGTGFVDEKVDVYALGVMLYQMLAGHPPFVAQSVAEPEIPDTSADEEVTALLRVALRMGEVMAMHMHTTAPPLRAAEPQVPEDLAALVHAMLAGKPDDRPSMLRVVARLEDLGAPLDMDAEISLEFNPEMNPEGTTYPAFLSEDGAFTPAFF